MQTVGLDCAEDDDVWDYALANEFAIVTKDEDYSEMSVLRGVPPKVIWLQLGNCTTAEEEDAFRDRFADIEAFANDPSAGVFVLN